MIVYDASLMPQHLYGATLQLWHLLIQTCACVANMLMSPCMRFLSKLLLEHCKNKRLTNSVSAATAQQRPKSSLLTDEEQDAQYRAVINAARQNADVSSGLNSVSLLLMQQYVMHLHKAADQVHCPQPATARICPACFA